MDMFTRDRLLAFELAQQERVLDNARARDRTLAEGLERGFNCGVCLERLCVDSVFPIRQCDHTVCQACMRGHVTAQIRAGHFPVHCPVCSAAPGESAPTELSDFDMRDVLTQDEFDRYHQMSLERGSAGLLRCTQPDCNGRGDADFRNPYMFRCPMPECAFEYCVNCEAPWHQESTCEEFQEWKKANADGDNHMARLQDERQVQPCPNCKNGVERNGGCDQMTCRCGTRFVWKP
eukprot:Selendium_serpulae@DN4511_c0_g1_i1.p1